MEYPLKALTAAILAAFLIAGCSQPLALGSVGKTTLTLKAGSAGVRTLLPSLGTYDLTLTSSAHATITRTGSTTGTFTLTDVPNGNWTAQIIARVGGTQVASGSATVSLAVGDTESLEVPLVYDTSLVTAGNTGGIQLKIVTSASPYPVASASATLRNPAGATTTPVSTFNPADGSLSFALTGLASGSWTLNVVFFGDSQKSQPTARVHDQIVVVDGVSAYPDLVLSSEAFSAPGKVEMVAIAGGTFTYGTSQATVSPYWIGKYTITQAQFRTVMGFNPSYSDNSDIGVHGNPEAAWSPVENMSPWDAMEYTNRLSRAEGLDPVYTLSSVTKSGNSIDSATVTTDLSKNGYRLPTDAEWEFAARAGNTGNDPFGGNNPEDYAWVIENSSPRTNGVGQKLPNPWGLYDTWGNVYQLTTDFFGAIPSGSLLDYAGPASPGAHPGYYKAYRGSFIEDSAGDLTNLGYSGYRTALESVATGQLGFRIARNQGTRVYSLNFENLNLGDLNGQDGWVVRTVVPANNAPLSYVPGHLSVVQFGVGPNQSRMLTLETEESDATRPLAFPVNLNDPDATYVLSWETQKNAWGTEVGIGADLNGNGSIETWLDTSERALAVNLRQNDNGNGAHKAELLLPDGGFLSQDITAMPNENTPPGWVRVELLVHQNSVSVRWKNLATGMWTSLWSGQTFTTNLSATKANPILWNKLYLFIQHDGARLDNISFVKLNQSQTTMKFETNGGSPVAPLVTPVGGRLSLPTPPQKPTYTFQGWYRDAGLTDPWDPAASTVTNNMVLYAGWNLSPFAKRTTGGAGFWNSVTASADAIHLAATSDNLFDIWTSSDAGITWTNRTTATAANGQNWRRVVSSTDGTRLAAAAYGGTLWTSTNSGVTWTSRGGINNWFDIATSADGTHLVASVPFVGVWTSADSGVTWTQTSLSTLRWAGVASNANGSRLVVGVFGGAAWTSADYGATWTEQVQLNSAFDSIASSASGQYLAQTGYEKLAVSSDYGVTWTTFNDFAKYYGNVVMSADGSVMTVIEQVSGDLWTSSDFGATWTNRTTGTAANSIGPPTWTWGGLAASSDGLILVAGAGNTGPGEIWSGVLP